MDDGLAHARSSAGAFQESVASLGSAVRRWTETADGVRASWDDGAGRAVFQRFLDPHRELTEEAMPLLAQALEVHESTLVRITQAGESAARASEAAAHAAAAAAAARRATDAARAQAAAGRAAAQRAHALAQGVITQVAGLLA